MGGVKGEKGQGIGKKKGVIIESVMKPKNLEVNFNLHNKKPSDKLGFYLYGGPTWT